MPDWLEEGDQARRAGRFAAAEEAYRKAIEEASRKLTHGTHGRESLPLAEAEVKMGRLYESWGRPRVADEHYREALRIFSSVQGDEYFELALARDRVAVPEAEGASA
jgi:tetratricopeptide (TPR) repeat protein